MQIESTHKGVNWRSKEIMQTTFERSFFAPEDVPPVGVMYLVFTLTPGENYGSRVTSLLLCLCDVFHALMNSLECCLKRTVFLM